MQALVRLKAEHGFLLFLDDAHGTLTLGASGGGTAEAAAAAHGAVDAAAARGTAEAAAAAVRGAVDVHSGTLSKALGSLGGFVACSAATKAFLVNHARGYVFSTALPLPCVAAASAALHVFARCAPVTGRGLSAAALHRRCVPRLAARTVSQLSLIHI